MISIRLVDTEALVNLYGLPDKIQLVLQAKFDSLMEQLYLKVIENVTGKVLQTKSGQLAESIRVGVSTQGSLMIGYVEVDPATPKAKALEYGGKGSYWILVGDKGILANTETGFFSRKSVLHPPMKPYEYLRSALREMIPEFEVGLGDALTEALRGG